MVLAPALRAARPPSRAAARRRRCARGRRAHSSCVTGKRPISKASSSSSCCGHAFASHESGRSYSRATPAACSRRMPRRKGPPGTSSMRGSRASMRGSPSSASAVPAPSRSSSGALAVLGELDQRAGERAALGLVEPGERRLHLGHAAREQPLVHRRHRQLRASACSLLASPLRDVHHAEAAVRVPARDHQRLVAGREGHRAERDGAEGPREARRLVAERPEQQLAVVVAGRHGARRRARRRPCAPSRRARGTTRAARPCARSKTSTPRLRLTQAARRPLGSTATPFTIVGPTSIACASPPSLVDRARCRHRVRAGSRRGRSTASRRPAARPPT